MGLRFQSKAEVENLILKLLQKWKCLLSVKPTLFNVFCKKSIDDQNQ